MSILAALLNALAIADAAQKLFFELKATWEKHLTPEEKAQLEAKQEATFAKEHWKIEV